MDFGDVAKFVGLGCDSAVIFDFQDGGILLEDNAEVVLDGGEFFVCHFDTAARKQVDVIFSDNRVKYLRGLIKESAFNLSAVHVHETDFKKGTTFISCPFL